jgi:hypothetical protein
VPRVVGEGARILAVHAERHLFVSTVSVYEGWPGAVDRGPAVLECPADAGPSLGTDDPRGYPTQYGSQEGWLRSMLHALPCTCQIADALGADKLKLIHRIRKGNGLMLSEDEFIILEESAAAIRAPTGCRRDQQ